jgi:cytochrome c-type biogenesis protein
VFTSLGAGAGAIGDLLTEHRRTLEIVSGVLIVLMGAVLAGFGGMLFQQERRLGSARKPAGPLGAVLAGAGFGLGWTPCVGPTLAAILTLAGRSGHTLDGAILLAVYSLGLGVPFLLSGLLFTRGLASLAPLRRRTPLLVRASGVVLICLGVLLALGQMTAITSDLSSAFPALV